MNLLDRIRHAKPDDDLAEALGLRHGDRLKVDKDGVTVGGQTFPLAAIVNAMRKPALSPLPARAVEIRDLGTG